MRGPLLSLKFLGKQATLLPKKHNAAFAGQLAKLLVQDDNICRKIAAEILEHLCIQYAENGEYLSTLKNTITGVMPEVRTHIILYLFISILQAR